MWVCSWEQHGQFDSNISIWNTEADALVAAGSKVMNDVAWWDLSKPDVSQRAYEISDKCALMAWREAIDLYNEWECRKDTSVSCYISVYEKRVKSSTPSVALLRPPPASPQSVMPPVRPTSAPFKATKEGATCRGPCNQFNEYAYADQPDGTYCCRQCKWMSQVFGGKVT